MIYTSYIFEVLKVFKGELDKRFIEIPIQGGSVGDVSLSIPSCGTSSIGTGILFLSVPDQNTFENSPFNSSDTLAKHFIVNAIYDALLYNAMYSTPPVYLENVESNSYQYIERLTNIKRKVIQNSEIQDPKIREWLKQNNKENLLREHGINFSFFKSKYIGGHQQCYSFYLWATSTSGFTDLNQAEIMIHYNSESFGNYAVKNKTAMLSDVFLNRDAYQVDLFDHDSSNFVVRIKLANQKKSVFQLKNNLVGIRMKVRDMESKSKIYLVNSKCKAKYFDYNHNKISKYAYVYGLDTAEYLFSYNLKPAIRRYFPYTTRAEIDTLTIEGKYLICKRAKVQVQCARDKCSFARDVPQEYFIIQTDTLLKFKMPRELISAGNACGKVLPVVSGFYIIKEVEALWTKSERDVVVIQ